MQGSLIHVLSRSCNFFSKSKNIVGINKLKVYFLKSTCTKYTINILLVFRNTVIHCVSLDIIDSSQIPQYAL